MGNQSSEMKAKYTGRPGVDLGTAYSARVQPFNLSDHHLEGSSKVSCWYIYIQPPISFIVSLLLSVTNSTLENQALD